MTVYWYCRTCTACGEGDKDAEQHVRETQHTTETSRVRRHPGSAITVTGGPFGRAYFECSCGEQQTRASKSAAVRVALQHHHKHNGCDCSDEVRALPEHVDPRAPTAEERQSVRYWLTDKGWAAAGGQST